MRSLGYTTLVRQSSPRMGAHAMSGRPRRGSQRSPRWCVSTLTLVGRSRRLVSSAFSAKHESRHTLHDNPHSSRPLKASQANDMLGSMRSWLLAGGWRSEPAVSQIAGVDARHATPAKTKTAEAGGSTRGGWAEARRAERHDVSGVSGCEGDSRGIRERRRWRERSDRASNLISWSAP